MCARSIDVFEDGKTLLEFDAWENGNSFPGFSAVGAPEPGGVVMQLVNVQPAAAGTLSWPANVIAGEEELQTDDLEALPWKHRPAVTGPAGAGGGRIVLEVATPVPARELQIPIHRRGR